MSYSPASIPSTTLNFSSGFVFVCSTTFHHLGGLHPVAPFVFCFLYQAILCLKLTHVMFRVSTHQGRRSALSSGRIEDLFDRNRIFVLWTRSPSKIYKLEYSPITPLGITGRKGCLLFPLGTSGGPAQK